MVDDVADSDRMHFLDVQREPEKAARRIVAAYDAAEAEMGATARALGVSRSGLHRWIAYLRPLLVERTVPSYVFGREMDAVRERHAGAVHARLVATGRLGGRPPARKKRRAR